MSKKTLTAKEKYDFSDLCELIDILRAPDGCPWDREQTHQSIRKGLIEETYEVVEGIDSSDNKIMCEELGDLLMQVVFHAAIARDESAFDMSDICTGICKKLIYRHPHVFSDVNAKSVHIFISFSFPLCHTGNAFSKINPLIFYTSLLTKKFFCAILLYS